ncbi:unnamed protein product [Rhizoctonia solani]|uniref:non-specific serine/threonine protein kinase n=1 Tax=Rhizoctonia solani TaxID=456999 RepID=A0A8H3BHB7_9AGAM|nr:unnamed protein product [Rhizoctonia solani]
MTSVITPSKWVYEPSPQPELEYRATSDLWAQVAGQSQTHIHDPVARYNDTRLISERTTTIRKGVELGSGGFARVFKAVQVDTQRIVALKQCRASLRLKRPLLQHEASILKLLSGHRNIPEVYAYGRIEHFELMSMQLLHHSLGAILKEGGPLSIKVVANLADQMMDALQHVHSHGLVHRDIKPDNIMLKNRGSWELCLIDFGLTRPLSDSRVATENTPSGTSSSTLERPAYIFGTLPFASLNAHERDSQLMFRDDLESLAYTLLWLLRGDLPWSHYAKSGTRAGRIRQVFAQKKRHTDSTMAVGIPAEFGELVDCARSLSLDEKPDYEGWRRRFQQVESNASDGTSILGPRAPKGSAVPPKPPVDVGQIVLVKLNPSVTADGYAIREGHESSFISDPIFDDPEWRTTYRPAVVAQVEWDGEIRKHQFLAIAISRQSDLDKDATTPSLNIGIWWTGAWFPAKYQPEEGHVTDSYSEPDYSMWRPQSERRKSITLAGKNEHIEGLGKVLTGLTKIVALEKEPKGCPT